MILQTRKESKLFVPRVRSEPCEAVGVETRHTGSMLDRHGFSRRLSGCTQLEHSEGAGGGDVDMKSRNIHGAK